MTGHRLAIVGGLLFLLAGSSVQSAEGQGWGAFKGQVVWAGQQIPPRAEINVTQDKEHCLKDGPLLEEKYVIDKKTNGVQWVMVWLADAKEPKNPNVKIPIHPDLANLKNKSISFDQHRCAFEPHVFGVIAGQTVVAKNSAPVPHNVRIEGGANNPTLNQLLPPGSELQVMGWNPTTAGAVPISCSIHGWMKSYARVFNHPYFAVTNAKGEFEIKDAPAGTYRLIVWHPEGWVATREGMKITIKAKETVDLGKIDYKP